MQCSELVTKELNDILAQLAEARGEAFAARIRTLFLANCENGRLQYFLANPQANNAATPTGAPQTARDYLQRLVAYYDRCHAYAQQIQVDQDAAAWELLLDKIGAWAFKFIERGWGYLPIGDRIEYAADCRSLAGATLVNARFPYDVEFDRWACVLTHKVCYGYMRETLRRFQRDIPPEKRINQDFTELDELLRQAGRQGAERALEELVELRACLQQALAKLTPPRRHVIEQHYFEGKSFGEIAQALHSTLNAVYQQHYHALRDLKKILGDDGNKDE
jgi:RNA polymerase sigma factor (sigma-70 family)